MRLAEVSFFVFLQLWQQRCGGMNCYKKSQYTGTHILIAYDWYIIKYAV